MARRELKLKVTGQCQDVVSLTLILDQGQFSKLSCFLFSTFLFFLQLLTSMVLCGC